MSESIRVAELSELPPGKGKVVELGDRRVTVFNLDGRLRATATRHARALHTGDTSCATGGLTFDVFAEDSPAKLRADAEECSLHVDGQTVYVEITDEI